jgi:transposase
MREIVNGIFYVMRAGCPWRLLPNDLLPWGTIYRWFATWRDDGRFERIPHLPPLARPPLARGAMRKCNTSEYLPVTVAANTGSIR